MSMTEFISESCFRGAIVHYENFRLCIFCVCDSTLHMLEASTDTTAN